MLICNNDYVQTALCRTIVQVTAQQHRSFHPQCLELTWSLLGAVQSIWQHQAKLSAACRLLQCPASNQLAYMCMGIGLGAGIAVGVGALIFHAGKSSGLPILTRISTVNQAHQLG